MNIPYTTTHIVLINLLKKKIINKKQALNSLRILEKEGRYSVNIVLYYYDQINEVK